MTAGILHAPAALVEAQLGADGRQGRARAAVAGRRAVDQARVAVAQRRADPAAPDRLQICRAVRSYCSSVTNL